MHLYWTVRKPSYKEKRIRLARKKRVVSLGQRLTPPQSQWQKYKNWASNRFLVHIILQTWLRVTSFYSPTCKDLAWWEEILVQWRSNRYRKCVFRKPQDILLFWRDEKIDISPDWVWSHWMRQCWEIKVNFSENSFFTCFFYQTLSNDSRTPLKALKIWKITLLGFKRNFPFWALR